MCSRQRRTRTEPRGAADKRAREERGAARREGMRRNLHLGLEISLKFMNRTRDLRLFAAVVFEFCVLRRSGTVHPPSGWTRKREREKGQRRRAEKQRGGGGEEAGG